MKSTLYGAIKKSAYDRDRFYKAFSEANHPDARKIFNLNNHVVNDLVEEYKAAGGSRPLERFVREDL